MACGSTVSFGTNGEILYDLAAKCRLPPGTAIVREKYETLLTVSCTAWGVWPNMRGFISVDNYGSILLTVEGCKWYFVREVAFTPPELAAIICPIMTKIASGWKVHLSALPGWLPTSQPVHMYYDPAIPCIGSDCKITSPLNYADSDCSSMRKFHFVYADGHAGTDGFHLFRAKRTAIVADDATEGCLPQFRLLELDRMRCEAVEDMLEGCIMERVHLKMFEAWVASVGSLVAGGGVALTDEVPARIQAELTEARAALSDAESRVRDLSEMLERIRKAAAAVGSLGDASSALQRPAPPQLGTLRSASQRLATQTPGKM